MIGECNTFHLPRSFISNQAKHKSQHTTLALPTTTKKKKTLQLHSLLLGFWTLSIVRNSINKKTQRFGNWICPRPQVRGAGAPTLLGTLENLTVTLNILEAKKQEGILGPIFPSWPLTPHPQTLSLNLVVMF
jgi:hypothetical protein